MIEKLIGILRKNREIVMYVFVGGCTTLVNWVIYALMMNFGANMTVSNYCAWMGAVLFAFLANKLLVFESTSRKPSVVARELLTFFGSRILTGAAEVLLPEQLYKLGLDMPIFGVEGMAAKLVVSVFTVIANYVLGKFLVFRKKNSGK